MARTKPEGGVSVHTTLRIPRELHDRLVEAAGGQPLGDEIRRRLETSFALDPLTDDPKTREVVGAIAWIFKGYRVATLDGEQRWHEDAEAFWRVRAAVDQVIDHFRPQGADKSESAEIGARLLAGVALSYIRGEL